MWQVADAKNKFSELLSRADAEGPQRISRRGKTYLVMTESDYLQVQAAGKQPEVTLADFILNGPSLEGLEFPRETSPGREVDLG